MENVNLSMAKDLADRWLACAKARGVSSRQLLETMLDGLETPNEPEGQLDLDTAPIEPSYGAKFLSFGEFARLAGWDDAGAVSRHLDSKALNGAKPRLRLTDPKTGKTYTYLYLSPYVYGERGFKLVTLR